MSTDQADCFPGCRPEVAWLAWGDGQGYCSAELPARGWLGWWRVTASYIMCVVHLHLKAK